MSTFVSEHEVEVCWCLQGEGAWEPKERASKKVAQRSSNLQKANSRPTSSNAHAQQSSDAPSSAEGVPPVNDPDAHGREVRLPLCVLAWLHQH